MTRISRPPLQSLLFDVALPRLVILLGWWGVANVSWLSLVWLLPLMLADLVFLIWQCRSFLASADAHLGGSGNMAPVWGGYLVLLLAFFLTASQWWQAVLNAQAEHPQTSYAEQQAQERAGLYHLYLSPDGRILTFEGEVTFGLTKRVRQVQQENPQLRSLHLASPGGLIAEARGVAALVLSSGLDTRAVGPCDSACTLIFAAGATRSLAEDGQLGFHSYAVLFPQTLPSIDVQKEQEKDRQFLRGRGVAPTFIDRIYSLPNSDIWRPDRVLLRQSGMITN